jgi:DNA processing protein
MFEKRELMYRLWFARIEISNKIKRKLLDEFTEEEIFVLDIDELIDLGLTENQVLKMLDVKYKDGIDELLIRQIKEGIKQLKYTDKLYPELLKEIPDNPVYIFVKGDVSVLKNTSYAIVGSRKSSISGIKIARSLAYKIAKENINVVSGLAYGIDTAAHIGALDYKQGKTIAVLGNGLLEKDIYPKENLSLFKEIITRGGAIISEYVIGTKPEKYHFPARNRIISGLSEKIVVVEAGIKSGSLITVDFALEQGRDVYAVPGNILEVNSKGVNNLIKEGAKLLDSYEDLYD